MLNARRDHTASPLPSGNVLVAGGQGPNGFLASTELYNPANGTWTLKAPMISSRFLHTAVTLEDGRVFVNGGWANGAVSSSPLGEVYDPATNMWSATPPMIFGRSSHISEVLDDGNVLVVGGPLGEEAEVYHPTTNTWSPAGMMSVKRYFFAS
jgi:hypothetical protein